MIRTLYLTLGVLAKVPICLSATLTAAFVAQGSDNDIAGRRIVYSNGTDYTIDEATNSIRVPVVPGFLIMLCPREKLEIRRQAIIPR